MQSDQQFSRDGYRWDVFISYTDCDRKHARKLVKGWRKTLNLKVFFDKDCILPGERLTQTIPRAVVGSRYVVCVLSRAALKSKWVQAEIGIARMEDPAALRRKLIPVLIEEIPSAELGYLSQLNAVRLYDPDESDREYRRLAHALTIVSHAPLALPSTEVIDDAIRIVSALFEPAGNSTNDGPSSLVELLINADFNRYSEADLKTLSRKIKEQLRLKREPPMRDKSRGSVRVTFELPSNKAEELVEFAEEGGLGMLGVTSAHAADPRTIFISYAGEDSVLALDIKAKLEEEGFRCWMAEWELHAGNPIGSTLAKQVHQADAFIVLVSAHSVRSPWVEDEVAWAYQRTKTDPGFKLIPILRDGTPPPPVISHLVHIDWREGARVGFDRLLRALGRVSLAFPESPPAVLRTQFYPKVPDQGGVFYPVYIFALDPPISAWRVADVNPRAREWAETYGQAMIKLALLLGTVPVVAENQVYDGRPVLKAAADEQFRLLVREGRIILSFRDAQASYSTALARYLARQGAISSAWPQELREDLLAVLQGQTVRPVSTWDADSGDLLEGLRHLSSMPRSEHAQARSVAKSLPERILPFADEVLPGQLPEDVAHEARRFIRAVHDSLPDMQKPNRSAWIDAALSDEFADRYFPDVTFGIREVTVSLALLAYQEIVCESVAEANALRSVATVPMGFNTQAIPDMYPSQLLVQNVDRAGLLSAIPTGSPGKIIDVSALSQTEEHIRNIAEIPWGVVREIVTDREFTFFVNLLSADRNEEITRYMRWLGAALGSASWGSELTPEAVGHRARESAHSVAMVLGSGAGNVALDSLLSMLGLNHREPEAEALVRRTDVPWVTDASVEQQTEG